MKLSIYLIKDKTVNAFLPQPLIVKAQGEAYRIFTDAINKPEKDTDISRHPDEYDLYYSGDLDLTSGAFNTEESAIFEVSGSSVHIPKAVPDNIQDDISNLFQKVDQVQSIVTGLQSLVQALKR